MFITFTSKKYFFKSLFLYLTTMASFRLMKGRRDKNGKCNNNVFIYPPIKLMLVVKYSTKVLASSSVASSPMSCKQKDKKKNHITSFVCDEMKP